MGDMSFGEFQLRGLVLVLGHRFAAVVGAFIALLSLILHTHVTAACLRGGLAWIGLLLLTRAVHWLTGRTYPRAQGESQAAASSVPEASRE